MIRDFLLWVLHAPLNFFRWMRQQDQEAEQRKADRIAAGVCGDCGGPLGDWEERCKDCYSATQL